LLLQTSRVLHSPGALVQLHEALKLQVPMLCVVVARAGYEFAAARTHLSQLASSLDSEELATLRRLLYDRDVRLPAVSSALAAAVPKIISIPFEPSGTEADLIGFLDLFAERLYRIFSKASQTARNAQLAANDALTDAEREKMQRKWRNAATALGVRRTTLEDAAELSSFRGEFSKRLTQTFSDTGAALTATGGRLTQTVSDTGAYAAGALTAVCGGSKSRIGSGESSRRSCELGVTISVRRSSAASIRERGFSSREGQERHGRCGRRSRAGSCDTTAYQPNSPIPWRADPGLRRMSTKQVQGCPVTVSGSGGVDVVGEQRSATPHLAKARIVSLATMRFGSGIQTRQRGSP